MGRNYTLRDGPQRARLAECLGPPVDCRPTRDPSAYSPGDRDEDTGSGETGSGDLGPGDIGSEDITSEGITSEGITSEDVTSEGRAHIWPPAKYGLALPM